MSYGLLLFIEAQVGKIFVRVLQTENALKPLEIL